jgi:hypothetical protein
VNQDGLAVVRQEIVLLHLTPLWRPSSIQKQL